MKHDDKLIYFKDYLTSNLTDCLKSKKIFNHTVFEQKTFDKFDAKELFIPYEREMILINEVDSTSWYLGHRSKNMQEYAFAFDACIDILNKALPCKEEHYEMYKLNNITTDYVWRIDTAMAADFSIKEKQNALPEYIILQNKANFEQQLEQIILKTPVNYDTLKEVKNSQESLQEFSNSIWVLVEELKLASENYLYQAQKENVTQYFTTCNHNKSGGHSR
ncbi:MAG: hypothetical protein ACP5N1_01430 [Candidatus Woesearchaeota archaeon]